MATIKQPPDCVHSKGHFFPYRTYRYTSPQLSVNHRIFSFPPNLTGFTNLDIFFPHPSSVILY